MAQFLIVDDNMVNRSLLEHLLSDYGRCILAEDGHQALSTFEALHAKGEPVDVIFMDVMMPNMSGLQALEQLRKWEMDHGVEKGVDVVMVSALKESEDIQVCLDAGARHYLVKPYKEHTVFKLLSQLGLEPVK